MVSESTIRHNGPIQIPFWATLTPDGSASQNTNPVDIESWR